MTSLTLSIYFWTKQPQVVGTMLAARKLA